MKQYRLVLAHHTVEEWAAKRAQQARDLGCSEAYARRLARQLRARAEVRADGEE